MAKEKLPQQVGGPGTITQASCADDYDPNSMPVDKARAFIHRFLEPVTA